MFFIYWCKLPSTNSWFYKIWSNKCQCVDISFICCHKVSNNKAIIMNTRLIVVKHEEPVGSDLVNSSLEKAACFSWLETGRLWSWCCSCNCGWFSRAEKYWKIFCRPPQIPPAHWRMSGSNSLQLSDIGRNPPYPRHLWDSPRLRWSQRLLWREGRWGEAGGSGDIWTRQQRGPVHWRGNQQNRTLRVPLLL